MHSGSYEYPIAGSGKGPLNGIIYSQSSEMSISTNIVKRFFFSQALKSESTPSAALRANRNGAINT